MFEPEMLIGSSELARILKKAFAGLSLTWTCRHPIGNFQTPDPHPKLWNLNLDLKLSVFYEKIYSDKIRVRVVLIRCPFELFSFLTRTTKISFCWNLSRSVWNAKKPKKNVRVPPLARIGTGWAKTLNSGTNLHLCLQQQITGIASNGK